MSAVTGSTRILTLPRASPASVIVLKSSSSATLHTVGRHQDVFNKDAFVAAPAGQRGNFGRNVLRGFGASQADVALHSGRLGD